MRFVPAPLTRTLATGAFATALALGVSAAPVTAGGAGCGTFASQAAAQERFVAIGGDPGHDAGGLDRDGNGVACEGLSGPYEGFATIGYNRAKRFFYGTATMPARAAGEGEFACLYGNRHFSDGPRLLKIYRVVPGGPDRPVSRDIGVEVRAESGRLFWKLDRAEVTAGVYYAAFEERIRTSPYAPSECPGFRSAATQLPRPQR